MVHKRLWLYYLFLASLTGIIIGAVLLVRFSWVSFINIHLDRMGIVTPQERRDIEDMLSDFYLDGIYYLNARRRLPRNVGGKIIDPYFFGVWLKPRRGFNGPQLVQQLRALGVTSLKCVMIYGQENKEIDRFLRSAADWGALDIAVTLELRLPVTAAANIKLWRRFAGDVFSRYSRYVTSYQLGYAVNIPDKSGFRSPKKYTRVYQAVAAVARNYPGVRLVAPNDYGFEPYWPAYLAKKAMPHNIHILGSGLDVNHLASPRTREWGVFDLEEKINMLRLIARYNGISHIWITRFGWRYLTPDHKTKDRTRGWTEEEAARLLCRYVVTAAGNDGVSRIFLDRFQGDLTGLLDERGRKRSAYYVYRFLIRTLNRVKGISREKKGNVIHYRFGLVERRIILHAAWAVTDDGVLWRFKRPVTVFSMKGKPSRRPVSDLLITKEPVFWYTDAQKGTHE